MRCEQLRTDGRKTVKLHSYVAILCRKRSGKELQESQDPDVIAVRVDHAERKTDVMKMIWNELPMYNIKSVLKLYDDDFTRGGKPDAG